MSRNIWTTYKKKELYIYAILHYTILEGVMKCVFLNTRSLHKHISDVQSSHNIKEADLVILAETQLKSSDVNTDYEIDNHQHILRNDQEYNGRTRPAHGIIGYVKDGI